MYVHRDANLMMPWTETVNFDRGFMDVFFLYKMARVNPLHKSFYVIVLGGIALPFYRQSICFHFMETFWEVQTLSFY